MFGPDVLNVSEAIFVDPRVVYVKGPVFGPRVPSVWSQGPQHLVPSVWSPQCLVLRGPQCLVPGSPAFGPHSVWSTGVLSAWSQGPQCLVLRVPSVWSSGSPVFVPRVPSICSQGPQCLAPKALSVWSPGSPVFGPQGSPIFGFGGGGAKCFFTHNLAVLGSEI